MTTGRLIDSSGRRSLNASGARIIGAAGDPCCCRKWYRVHAPDYDLLSYTPNLSFNILMNVYVRKANPYTHTIITHTNNSGGNYPGLIFGGFFGNNYTDYGLISNRDYALSSTGSTEPPDGAVIIPEIPDADFDYYRDNPTTIPSSVAVKDWTSDYFGAFPIADFPDSLDDYLPLSSEDLVFPVTQTGFLAPFYSGPFYFENRTWRQYYGDRYILGGLDGTTRIPTDGMPNISVLGDGRWFLQFRAEGLVQSGGQSNYNLWAGTKPYFVDGELPSPLGVYARTSGSSTRATIEVV